MRTAATAATVSGKSRAASAVELIRLRDGSSVTVRRASGEDEPALLAFLSGLCLEARRLRFFTGAANLAYAAHEAAATDAQHCGLIAHDEAGTVVGHATYVQLDDTHAEVAVEVADYLHGRGLGTILIERLAMIAEERGITHFVAEVLAENRAMLDVFREGFDARVVHRDGPEERVEFLTSGWRLAHKRFAVTREARASLRMFRKVIVGVDGSEQARDALRLATTLTASDGEVVVCCVHRLAMLSARVDPSAPDLDREQAEQCVEEARQLHDGAPRIRPLLVAGVAGAMALQHTAAEQHADLLVLGSSHRGAAGRVLVGSVTEETLHGAPCPVAVAPVGFHRSPKPARIASIAVAYDDGVQAGSALQVAGELAGETGAHLQVIAIANTATAMVVGSTADLAYSATVNGRVHIAERNVAAAIASLPSGLTVTSEVRMGLPPEEILRSSRSVDLLVLGCRRRGPLRRLVLGSVSDAVVRAAACPVLIVPPLVETAGLVQPVGDTRAGA